MRAGLAPSCRDKAEHRAQALVLPAARSHRDTLHRAERAAAPPRSTSDSLAILDRQACSLPAATPLKSVDTALPPAGYIRPTALARAARLRRSAPRRRGQSALTGAAQTLVAWMD